MSETLTGTVLRHFEHEIARAVVLALFIPLLIGTGGNAGSQTASLIIRSLALGEIRLRDWWRVLRREIASGLVLGGVLGLVGFLRISFGRWYRPTTALTGRSWRSPSGFRSSASCCGAPVRLAAAHPA